MAAAKDAEKAAKDAAVDFLLGVVHRHFPSPLIVPLPSGIDRHRGVVTTERREVTKLVTGIGCAYFSVPQARECFLYFFCFFFVVCDNGSRFSSKP